MRPRLGRRTTVLSLPLTVTSHNGWCIVHKHTHAGHMGAHKLHKLARTVLVVSLRGRLYYVLAVLKRMCESCSEHTGRNNREQNIFVLRDRRWFHNKSKNSVLWRHAWVKKSLNVCVCVCACVEMCARVCLRLGSLPSCIRINSLVDHVGCVWQTDSPHVKPDEHKWVPQRRHFREEDCPCDTYREGHLTAKEEVWVTAGK